MRNPIPFIKAIAETIREVGEYPSGHLYAMVMPLGVSLNEYEAVIALLVREKLVECTRANLLRWIGPEIEAPIVAGKVGV